MATSYHHFVCCNKNIYEDDDKLPSSSYSLQHHHKRDDNTLSLCSFQTQRRINTQENKPKKNKKREGAHLQSFVLPLHFWLLLLTFLFQMLFLTFFFSIAPKKKKKKDCKERMELSFKLPICPLTFGSHFYPPTFALLFQTHCFRIFFFSNRRKKKKT